MRATASAGARMPAPSSASASAATEAAAIPGTGSSKIELRRRIDEEHVRRGDGAVDEGGCLQAGIANPQGDEGQEQRLGRPGDRQARSRQQVGGRDGGKRERRDTEDERKGRLHAAKREPGTGPDHGRAGEREALVAVDVPERPHEQEREADRSEHERARERIEIRLAGDELQPDPRREHDQHERGDDGGGACPGRRVGIESEQCNLCADDDADPDQQLVPATRDGERNRCGEDDHRERDGGPREPRVDRLQGRRERRSEQPDRGDRLGRPCDRDHDGDRRKAARERKREPVRHEVVAGRGRGQRGVATRDARAGGAERHLQLAVARPHPERDADGRRRDAGAEGDAHGRRDPAAVRGEHEEQDDAEGRDGAADDREAARAEQIPVGGELRGRAARSGPASPGSMAQSAGSAGGARPGVSERGRIRRVVAAAARSGALLDLARGEALPSRRARRPASARRTDSGRFPRGSIRAGAGPWDRCGRTRSRRSSSSSAALRSPSERWILRSTDRCLEPRCRVDGRGAIGTVGGGVTGDAGRRRLGDGCDSRLGDEGAELVQLGGEAAQLALDLVDAGQNVGWSGHHVLLSGPVPGVARAQLHGEVAVECLGETEQRVDARRPAAVLEAGDGALRCRAEPRELDLGEPEGKPAFRHLGGDRGEEPAVVCVGEPAAEPVERLGGCALRACLC